MYKKQFQKDVEEFLKNNNYDVKNNVVYSDYKDFHYQTPILFTLKEKYKDFNNEDLINYLKATGHYSSIELTGVKNGKGFISVKCNLLENNQQLAQPKKTVLVDYCGVNVAKQMHIGHIRSMFIGDFVVRAHNAKNDNVVINNHIGDWGNQFGFLLHYILSNFLEENLDNKKLTQYYKEAYAKNESDPEFAKASSEVAYKLQNFLDPVVHQLWEKLVDISMNEAQKTFTDLNLKINIHHTQGESFYAPMCKDVLKDLLEKNIATTSDDGSVVVFFDKKSPLVLQKSNGNYLYALYDLAAIKWRVNNVNPDKIVYVVDKRQALHFEQVFEVAQKAGYAKNVELLHLGFGTILGNDKKPLKTKSGESLYLDDLLEDGKKILLQDVHFVNMNEAFKTEVLNKTIVGGMKFYDLKFNKTQDYIFDWDYVLSFTGNSAPYVQNALVRIDSIFVKKYGLHPEYEKVDYAHNWNSLESNLIFQCQKTEEIISDITDSYASQALTTQMMTLCQAFHNYYESEKVLGSDTEKYKLQILNYVSESLLTACEVLGIESYPCEQKYKLLTEKQNKLSIK